MALPALALALLAQPSEATFTRLDAALAVAPAPQESYLDDDDERGFLGEGLGAWPVGGSLMQGYIGVLFLDSAEVSGGATPTVDLADDAFEMLPAMGGGVQYKLGGARASWGVECMVDFAGRADGVAFYSGSGGALVALDVDLASVSIGGGPFVSTALGQRVRAYAALGGLMQWTWYDQGGANTVDNAHGDGFGAGYYTRAGFEYLLPNHALLGLSGRWSEARVDLSGGLGHMDLAGAQVLVTVSRSL